MSERRPCCVDDLKSLLHSARQEYGTARLIGVVTVSGEAHAELMRDIFANPQYAFVINQSPPPGVGVDDQYTYAFSHGPNLHVFRDARMYGPPRVRFVFDPVTRSALLTDPPFWSTNK